MSVSLESLVNISPSIWPGKELRVQPGDLRIVAPMGIGIEGPFPLRPWDNPFAPSPAQFYSYHIHTDHPLRGAPLTEPAGGTVYFGGTPEQSDVEALLRLMGVHQSEEHYAVFLGHADDPEAERYLRQLRVVSRFGLKYMFRALTDEEYEAFPAQKVIIGELIWKFIEDQQETDGTGYSMKLSGAMGSDGDWAKETLAFGFMVENEYHGVYRVWSRAWLVTK